MHKFNDHLSKLHAGLYQPPPQAATLSFKVRHFAGNIAYLTGGWLEKNRDTLNPSITSILRESSDALIRELFSTSKTATGGLRADESAEKREERQESARELIQVLRRSVWGQEEEGKKGKGKRKNGPPPVSPVRRLSAMTSLPLSKTTKAVSGLPCRPLQGPRLQTLVTKLEATRPSFVRCIQPNLGQKAGKFDSDVVLRQLRNTGVMETIRIRRDGYSERYLFPDFLQLYRAIHFSLSGAVPETAESCRLVLEHVQG